MRCGHGLACSELVSVSLTSWVERFVLTLSVVLVFFTMYDDVSSFHLSGVGELQPTHQISLPHNENDMILCNHQSDGQHAFPNPNFVSELTYSVAFPMHERCWKLMTRMLDVDLIKKNMDIFLHAMCDPYDVTRPLLDPTGTYPLWLEWFKLLDNLTSGLYLNPQKFRAKDDARPSHMPPEFRGADPLNDPCLNDVITKYTTEYTMQRKMGFEPRSQPSIPTHPMSRRSQARFKTRNVFLPTELILNIADHLDNHEDIHALLLVFPNWHPMIPNSYWRRRFIEDNCLRSDEFPAVDAMDWQRVYLSGDKLLRLSLGWQNRQYILSRLDRIKDRFLERLERKDVEI